MHAVYFYSVGLTCHLDPKRVFLCLIFPWCWVRCDHVSRGNGCNNRNNTGHWPDCTDQPGSSQPSPIDSFHHKTSIVIKKSWLIA